MIDAYMCVVFQITNVEKGFIHVHINSEVIIRTEFLFNKVPKLCTSIIPNCKRKTY